MDSVQCFCVGAVYRIPLSARNAQPACEIHRMAVTHCSVLGFHPTSLPYSIKKKKTIL